MIHAAGESASYIGEPLENDTHAVALEVPNEQELLELEQKLLCLGIAHIAIREPDLNNQLMAIGIRPQIRTTNLRKALARYALVR